MQIIPAKLFSPHFTGYSRQRGSGIGSLAAGVGRVALPFAKKFLLPAVKSIGKALIANIPPDLVEVVSKKRSLLNKQQNQQ